MSKISKRKPMSKTHEEYFKLYCTGLSLREVAEKVGKSTKMLEKYSARYKWRELRAEVELRRRQNVVTSISSGYVTGMNALTKKLHAVVSKANKEGRELTDTETALVRGLTLELGKELRLEEGKPTEIQGGTGPMEIKVMLPPGGRFPGLMPPPANVQIVEQEPTEEADTLVIPEGSDE